jgi:hypothetical protein
MFKKQEELTEKELLIVLAFGLVAFVAYNVWRYV